MVVVTYDEFGGQWDHVSPPGQGGTPGVHDNMGPGTRIPALVLAPGLRDDFVVDHVAARHDVDHGDDRAPLRPAPGVARATPRSTTCRACSRRARRTVTTVRPLDRTGPTPAVRRVTYGGRRAARRVERGRGRRG